MVSVTVSVSVNRVTIKMGTENSSCRVLSVPDGKQHRALFDVHMQLHKQSGVKV